MNSLSTSASSNSSVSSSTSWFSGIVRGRLDKSSSLKMAGSSSSGGGLASNNEGPIKGKNQFRGVLFKYGPKSIQVAFKTGDYKQQVIFIGGLTDGFLATDYLEPLAVALDNEKWSLVQLLMSSSYSGYGTSSLEQDAMEIDQLISYLINKENSEGVVLLGHSTGCQDIVHYMRTNAACSRAVRAAILQVYSLDQLVFFMYALSTFHVLDYTGVRKGVLLVCYHDHLSRNPALLEVEEHLITAPVSDREYRATLPETAAMIDLATSMIKEGLGSDLMPKEADPSPITAYRYNSLCAYMGDDDMFSSDLNEHQLRMRLGHMSSTPCQVIFSMDDEYVPEYVDKKALVERLCRAMGGAEKVEIEYGNHSLSNRVQEAVQAIIDFVKREGPKGWDDPWS
ncbi:hypothetical protein Goarm_022515 [Gossypium armourianum]|uniref:Uncharacterized protein n=1 Tax=Gossypium armourianum TaxID=34283 RepID=A0A7J9KI17_9ROSI|nr:hypothetical protein [Gossypium armourianum]